MNNLSTLFVNATLLEGYIEIANISNQGMNEIYAQATPADQYWTSQKLPIIMAHTFDRNAALESITDP